MRDWSSDEYKQMQVSCSEYLLSETIAIHWRTKDESQKSISNSQMIYFYKSHSDAVLRWLLQFLSTFYKELFEDFSFSDSINLKKDDIWIKLSLSNNFWSYKEMNDWSFYSSSFWLE